jgi:Tol biopolymer transport system component
VNSSVYIVNVDGSGRRLLSRDAASPSWSWDGSLIAYDSTDGVRLITPDGVRSPEIGPKGPPAFSPDGSQIAVATVKGIAVVDSRSLQGSLVTSETGTGIFRLGVPAWYPGTGTWSVPPPRRRPAECVPC